MSIPTNVLQDMADKWADTSTWVAIFTAAAGLTGANEATGTPYAREQTAFAANTDGTRQGSQVEIFLPSGAYKEAGLYTAQTGGVFRGSHGFDEGDIEVIGTGASIKVTPRIELTEKTT